MFIRASVLKRKLTFKVLPPGWLQVAETVKWEMQKYIAFENVFPEKMVAIDKVDGLILQYSAAFKKQGWRLKDGIISVPSAVFSYFQ